MVIFFRTQIQIHKHFRFFLPLIFLFHPSSVVAKDSITIKFINSDIPHLGSTSSAPSCEPTAIFADKIHVIKYVSGSRQQNNASTYFEGTDILAEILNRYQGRILSWEQQNNLVDEITLLYIQNNFITSYAQCSSQNPETQELVVEVIEGFVAPDGISIVDKSGNDPETCPLLYKSYIVDYILSGITQPLGIRNLEERINFLSRDPRFESIKSTLSAGSDFGESTVTVEVIERKDCYTNDSDSVKLSVNLNNYSPPSVGTYRLGVGVIAPGPFDLANIPFIFDELAFVAEVDPFNLSSVDTTRSLGFSYRIPVNQENNGLLALSYENNRNKVIESSLERFDLRANSESFSIQYEQTIIQSPEQDLSLSLGLRVEDSQTFVFGDIPARFSLGPSQNGVSRASILTFGQRYIRRGLGSQLSLSSQVNLGTGLFDATQNSGSIPDGQFLSWNLQLQWFRRLSSNHLLAVSGDAQFAADSLLPINQLAIGGGQSVRGYSQNTLAGDNGFRLSVEDYISVGYNEAGRTNLFLIPFFDIGGVWNSSNNPNLQSDQNLILSTGLGFQWNSSSNFNARIDYGIPLINVPDSGNSLQESGLTFEIGYDLDIF